MKKLIILTVLFLLASCSYTQKEKIEDIEKNFGTNYKVEKYSGDSDNDIYFIYKGDLWLIRFSTYMGEKRMIGNRNYSMSIILQGK